jgi:hypothetical protein
MTDYYVSKVLGLGKALITKVNGVDVADINKVNKILWTASTGDGFTSCGSTNATERFDDTANTHTARAAGTYRYGLAGYSMSGYGFTSCGNTGNYVGTTERFDDTANTHTARTAATARYGPAGYSI